MSDDFTLAILYNGVLCNVNCTLRVSAYTYQFLCKTDNSEFILEKDDEGNLRALDADPFSGKNPRPDPGLVMASMNEMERILHERTQP